MIQTCKSCGGLWSDTPLESIAGTPCKCPAPWTAATQPGRLAPASWLDALKRHVAAMKDREDEHRRDRDDSQTKLDTVMKERMNLEQLIYKTEGASNTAHKLRDELP